MHIVRYRQHDRDQPRVGLLEADRLSALPVSSMSELLHHTVAEIRAMSATATFDCPAAQAQLLAPVDGAMEVWASGVTYLRSREARVEESAQKSVYELVYDAERPELFFKSPAWRVVVGGELVAIRSDSELNVPEPELALIINRHEEVVGFVACNDMSSRSVEGENPLYLPQAKLYAGSCALSAGIRPAWEVDATCVDISLTIRRGPDVVWHDTTSTREIRRPFTQLISHLFHSENYPDGVVLATGTGLVPEMDFRLLAGDVITVSIEQVGELNNQVVAGKRHFEFLAAGRPQVSAAAADR